MPICIGAQPRMLIVFRRDFIMLLGGAAAWRFVMKGIHAAPAY